MSFLFLSIAFWQAFATGLWEGAREVCRASSWGLERNENLEQAEGRGEKDPAQSSRDLIQLSALLLSRAQAYILMMGRERISSLGLSRGKHRVPVKRWAKAVLGRSLVICLRGSHPMFYCCYLPKNREVIDPCSSFPCGMLWGFRLFTIKCSALGHAGVALLSCHILYSVLQSHSWISQQ